MHRPDVSQEHAEVMYSIPGSSTGLQVRAFRAEPQSPERWVKYEILYHYRVQMYPDLSIDWQPYTILAFIWSLCSRFWWQFTVSYFACARPSFYFLPFIYAFLMLVLRVTDTFFPCIPNYWFPGIWLVFMAANHENTFLFATYYNIILHCESGYVILTSQLQPCLHCHGIHYYEVVLG